MGEYLGRTTSQAFYNIAKLNIGEISRRDCLLNDKSFADYINDQKANCLHDLEGIPEITTVESSQMVFSKRFHYRSFLLSIYYNIFGRSHFYKLLYLNSDPTYKKPFNNNDRETYIPALHFFKELYHLMSYLPEFLESPQKQARFDGDTGLSEIALIQHDPTDIDQFFAMWKNWLSNQNLDSRILPFQKNSYTSALFERFLQETNAYHPGRDSKQDIETKGKIATTYHVFPKPFFLHFTNDFRLYVKSNSNRILDPSNFSQDWEKEFLVITKWLACDVLQDQKYWKDFQGNHDACQEAQQYIQIL